MRWASATVVAAILLLPATATASPQQITATAASRVASHDPNVAKERGENGALTHSASMVDGNWQVAYFAHEEEVALVIVDPHTG